MSATPSAQLILTASCPNTFGIVKDISTLIAGQGGLIMEASHFTDTPTDTFFLRHVIEHPETPLSQTDFEAQFAPVAERYNMQWKVTNNSRKKRVVLLVSKQEHCLYDLLGRWACGELEIDIPCVISNHETHRALVEFHGLPFHHIVVKPENKTESYARMAQIFDDSQADAFVLARYMQILSPDLCERFAGKIINIHHSFLPSFVGAKPYHQAYARGVKMIGATCHYVTSELDEGPIIEQDIIRIDHSHTPDTLVRFGKDVEKTVLARGLRAHLEDRVIVHGRRTVIL